jgi:hypothetical protein
MIKYCSLVVFSFLFCCNSERSKYQSADINISGTWYIIMNDSIYEECIFSNHDVWSYDENAGTLEFKYEIRNDSVTFKHEEGDFSLHYTKIDSNQFLLQNSLMKTHYFKLDTKIDTVQLKAEDDTLLALYIDSLRYRRYTWLEKQGLLNKPHKVVDYLH